MEKNLKISSEALEKIAKEEARRYKAEWRKKNKDRVRESNKRYWLKKAMQRMEQSGEAVDNDR